jgi:hypothetical protein
MAKTALTQLQEQIEAIRREAYQAGYAAAMQAIRDFAARPGAASAQAPSSASTDAASAPRRRGRPPAAKAAKTPPRARAKAPQGRPRRGANAQMIAEVLQAIAPRAARPAEIRQALQRDKGVAIAFTSIRHALGQLEARRTVEQADSKTWRYLGAGASSG